MLSYFREIRNSLLTMGGVRKYLLYAIGEILLVMIGILLALQVNKWNQSRLDELKEQELLNAIYQDMRLRHFYQEEGYQFYKDVLKSAEQVLLLINDPQPIYDSDTLDQNIKILFKRWLGSAGGKTNIYDLLIGTGQLELLTSKALRDELSRFNSHLEYLSQYEEFQSNFVDNHLSPFINQYVNQLSFSAKSFDLDSSLYNSRFESSYDKLLDSREFSNLLIELMRHTRVLVNTYRRMGNQLAAIDSIAIAANPSIISVKIE